MAKLTLSERDAKRLGKMLRWYETQAGGGGPPEADGLRGRNEPSITFLNDSGETIPAYSIIELQEGGVIAEAIPYCKAVKPVDQGLQYAITDGVQVEKEKYGQCYLAGVVIFTYDTGTPTIGDSYGPEDNEWTATDGGSPAFITFLQILDETKKLAWGLLNAGNKFDLRWNNGGNHLLEKTTDGGANWTIVDTAVTCT